MGNGAFHAVGVGGGGVQRGGSFLEEVTVNPKGVRGSGPGLRGEGRASKAEETPVQRREAGEVHSEEEAASGEELRRRRGWQQEPEAFRSRPAAKGFTWGDTAGSAFGEAPCFWRGEPTPGGRV